MTEKPLSVIAIVRRGSDFLAVSRKHDHEDLGFPGGKVEPGESPEDAVIRELFEETGVKAKVFREVYGADSVSGRYFTRAYHIDVWEEMPYSKEEAWVGWVPASRFVATHNSFWPYYVEMFDKLGIEYR